MRRSPGALLEDAGLKVDLVENGAEAVTLAKKNTYDLILMDVQMPTMSGIDATCAIRSLPYYAATPIGADCECFRRRPPSMHRCRHESAHRQAGCPEIIQVSPKEVEEKHFHRSQKGALCSSEAIAFGHVEVHQERLVTGNGLGNS